MKLRRRQILHLAASTAILPVTSRFAWAENYPARPVHLIVGFFAGDLTDILSRILAERFAGRFGQQFKKRCHGLIDRGAPRRAECDAFGRKHA